MKEKILLFGDGKKLQFEIISFGNQFLKCLFLFDDLKRDNQYFQFVFKLKSNNK